MAERSGKIGLSHWPFDSYFFDDDIRIRKLIKYQGGKAPLVYIYLLCSIYRKRGYYILWDDELPFVISDKLGSGFDEGYVTEVIKCCATLGLFDADMFEQGVLTSVAIQTRYTEICASLRRKCTIQLYNLISPELPLNAEDNSLNAAIKGQNDEEMHTIELNRIEGNKESSTNVEPKKEADFIVAPADSSVPAKPKTLEERLQEYYNSLIPYVQKYGREMVRDFYDYWSEVSDGGNKMAWEKALTRKGTFNIAGRLATWKKKEDQGYGGSRSSKRGSSISEAVQATAIPEGGLGGQLDITKLLGQ